MTPLDLSALHLDAGSHRDRSTGLCLMEAVAWWAGEKHTDAPACVSPALCRYGVALNDVLSDDRRQALVRFVPLLPGTAGDGMDEARRYLALDWLVRTYAPAWLDLRPELADAASALRGLRRIDGAEALRAAMPVALSARAAAGAAAWDVEAAAVGAAARAAAWDAARAAAWDAARGAARDAAGAAAWAAVQDDVWDDAWDAAWAAAWAAVRAAVQAAAWAAAQDDAWDAAWAAIQDDAWDDAWDAAGDTARAALQPTVDRLQASAIDLCAAMIDPTKGTP